MPRHKFIANRVLTLAENIVLAQKLSEYHTGLRAFSRPLLAALPFERNSDDFIFDNQIIVQAVAAGARIGELSCPTRYAADSSSIDLINSIRYGLGVLRTICSVPAQPVGATPLRLPLPRPQPRPGAVVGRRSQRAFAGCRVARCLTPRRGRSPRHPRRPSACGAIACSTMLTSVPPVGLVCPVRRGDDVAVAERDATVRGVRRLVPAADGRFASLGDAVLRRTRASLAHRLHRTLPPGPVLDVGAGDGTLVEAFARHGREAVGLEPHASGPHLRNAEIEEMTEPGPRHLLAFALAPPPSFQSVEPCR